MAAKANTAIPEDRINIMSLIGPRNTQYGGTTSAANDINGTTIEEFSQVMDQVRLEDDLKTAISDMEHSLESQRGRGLKEKRKASLPKFSK